MQLDATSIGRLIAARADRTPNAVAIAAPGRPPLSYRGLADQVGDAVARLNALGVGRGERVALVLPNGPEAAAAFLAVAAGACCAPLNPGYTEDEFDFYLSDLGAAALIVPAEADSPALAAAARRAIPVLSLAPGEEAGRFSLEGDGAGGASAATGYAEADEVALALHTSGTTARPKLVPLTHANLLASARNVAETLALSGRDRCLNILPLFHIHGLVAAALASLGAGASLVCTPGFNALKFFAWLDEVRPTWYTAVPTMHQAILARAARNREIVARNSLRFIRSSSAPLPPRVLDGLEATFGVPVIESYGMTEAAHQMASNPLPPGVRKPGSVGPAAGPEIAVVDANGGHLPAGEPGEVVIRGPNVMGGYGNGAEANSRAFVGGWLRTGDQGVLDEDGYLTITGRIKEIINRGGEKVAPREVDEVLLSHPAVAEALTFAVPDPALGEDVGAAVVLEEGSEATADEIKAFAAERLAFFKVPRRLVIVPEIPKGPTGKPQRIGLAEKLGLGLGAAEAGATEADTTPPRSDLEAALAGLWREVLCLDEVGVRARFLDLGGDSLLATQLVTRIREALRVEITLLDVFDTPTIADMATRIKEKRLAAGRPGGREKGEGPPTQIFAETSEPSAQLRADAGPGDRKIGVPAAKQESIASLPIADVVGKSITKRPDPRRAPLSFNQEWRLNFDRMWPDHPLSNRPSSIHLIGPLDVSVLQRSFDEMIRRHETLRTVVRREDGSWSQVILPPEPMTLPVVDLTGLPSDRRREEALRLALAQIPGPIDPGRWPALRAGLARLDDEEHVLILTIHHLFFDGWSMSVLVRELGAVYEAFAAGRPSPLPDLAVQYGDFAWWQRERLQGASLDEQTRYWSERLAPPPPDLIVPTDRPRPDIPRHRCDLITRKFSRSLTEAARAFSREAGVSLFMTCVAAFQAMLHRHSGQEDIVLGCLVAGRDRSELKRLLGYFVNLLVLRTDLSGDPTVRELLARTMRVVVGALSHQDFHFAKIMELLGIQETGTTIPVAPVIIQLRNFPDAAYRAGDLYFKEFKYDHGIGRFDLTFDLLDGPDGLTLPVTFNVDMFDEDTIAGMIGDFEAMLERFVRHPDQRLSELPALRVAGEAGAASEAGTAGRGA
ncbi:MAG: condensation domain-containing protein [Alphaproteobacteria bacterium]